MVKNMSQDEVIKSFLSFLLPISLILCALESKAQENKIETTISAEVVSQYIWRGQDLGNVSLQPTLGISYKGFSLNACGSVGLSEPSDNKEIDITLNYTAGGFNIGLTDYWTNSGSDTRSRYFKYGAHETNHVFEANIGYDFNFAAIQLYTNFAGDDGVGNNDKRAYSSYCEASAPFSLGGIDWTATAGVVPYATDFYDVNGFSVTNLSLTASKEIKITDKFSLPIYASIVSNPQSQKAYFVFGMTFEP